MPSRSASRGHRGRDQGWADRVRASCAAVRCPSVRFAATAASWASSRRAVASANRCRTSSSSASSATGASPSSSAKADACRRGKSRRARARSGTERRPVGGAAADWSRLLRAGLQLRPPIASSGTVLAPGPVSVGPLAGQAVMLARNYCLGIHGFGSTPPTDARSACGGRGADPPEAHDALS